jgi:hypothetical protein
VNKGNGELMIANQPNLVTENNHLSLSSSRSTATTPWFGFHRSVPVPSCLLSDQLPVVCLYVYFQMDGTMELVQEFKTGTQFYSNFLTVFFGSILKGSEDGVGVVKFLDFVQSST